MKPVLFLLAMLLTATTYAQPQPVTIKKLQDHHFFGNDDELDKGLNFFVLTNRKDYEKMFGTTSRADTPHFAKEWMLVMVMPATNKETTLSFNRVSVKAGDFVEVYCDVNNKKHPITYQYNPIAVCVIPAQTETDKVDFYERNKKGAVRLMKTVTIKRRY